MLNRIGQFPEVAPEPVPFYKHPYKMFALTSITFLFWRTVQILSREENNGFRGEVAWGFYIPLVQNSVCLRLNKAYNFDSPVLNNAIISMHLIQSISFFDAPDPDELERSGVDMFIFRTALVAVTVLASLGLICYANTERPYQRP